MVHAEGYSGEMTNIDSWKPLYPIFHRLGSLTPAAVSPPNVLTPHRALSTV
jgi:hypothetical protein